MMKGNKGLKYFILASLCLACTGILQARQNPKEKVYQAFISDQMDKWESVILELNSKRKQLSYLQKAELLNFYYGYTGWLSEEGPKKKTETYIEEADQLMDELMAINPEEPDLYAFRGAFFGYKIGLSPLKAPFLGPKSMENIDRSIELGPDRPQGWIERGNALFYMPRSFGGSKEKALEAYKKAIRLMEKEPESLRHNWIYLNVLMILGQSYEKTGNLEEAKSTYEKALAIEPGFIYLRDELYPAFMRSYNEHKSSGN